MAREITFWCILFGVICLLFRPCFQGNIPAFRDAFHFYYPLDIWLNESTQDRLFPQYNPFDGTGVNLVGEATGGLFYPLRIVKLIPLSVPARIGIVLVLHALIAAAGAAYATRRMGMEALASYWAASAYGLSTPFLFQHCNPVFLIGAAWIPWVMAESWAIAYRTETLRPRLWVWVLSASAMYLGGDPQSTVNAAIVAGLAGLFSIVNCRSLRVITRQTQWLSCAALLLVGLTAIQWLPTWCWLQHSSRLPSRVMASQDLPLEPLRSDLPTLFRTLDEPNSKIELPHSPSSIYGFSVAPWHFLTLFWGASAGHYLPENSRWLQACRAEPRMWSPSLSIGLLPALLAFAGWIDRRTRNSQWFLLAVLFLAATAMCGNYGPTWILRHWLNRFGAAVWASQLPHDEVGSTYWLLTQCIPNYASFRYPAKWSVWFACALALSSAHALERRQASNHTFFRLCVCIVLFTLLSAIGLFLLELNPGYLPLRSFLESWLTQAANDPWLGKPGVSAVLSQWRMGCVLSLTTALAAAAMCFGSNNPTGVTRPFRTALLIAVTIAELFFISHRWLVFTEPPLPYLLPQVKGPMNSPSMERVWSNIGRANALGDTPREPTIAHGNWKGQLSDYQNEFQLGKLHLLSPHRGNLSAILSLAPRQLVLVRQHLARADDLRSENPSLDAALSWLGVTRRLVRDGRLRWQSVPNARPFLVISDLPQTQTSSLSKSVIESWQPDRLQIRVHATERAAMTVQLYQDGGWTAHLTPLAGNDSTMKSEIKLKPISSHIGLFQTMEVPAGQWQMTLVYQAPGLRTGAGITIATLILLHLAVLYLEVLRRWHARHVETNMYTTRGGQ